MSNPNRKATILVVDDTPQNIEILSGILADTHMVKVAASGKRALAIAQAEPPPDLILLDIMMPELDGYEVCRQLKRDDRTRDIPVIFVTAKGEVDDERTGFEVGAVDYIQKPVCAPIVLARVSAHLLIHRQRQELQHAYEELKSLEQLRDNLTHMIIHDMRSPLMGIMGGIQILSDKIGKDDEDQRFATMASSAANELNEMVTSLLDISRMESGQMSLNKHDGDMKAIAASAVESMKANAEFEEIRLAISGESAAVSVDEKLIRRVFQNLLNNAIKFSPAGSSVGVMIKPDAALVRVEVTDSGRGVPAEYREKIFEKFGQVEARQNKDKHSTGLGLTFCKLAIEAHGGRIGIDSEEGKGSTFWFELPRGAPREASDSDERTTP